MLNRLLFRIEYAIVPTYLKRNHYRKAKNGTSMKEKLLPLIRYLIIAFVDTVLSYSVYGILLFCGAHYLVGSVAGFTASTVSAFYLNTRFVFTPKGKKPEYTIRGLVKTFCSYGFTGVVTYNLLLMMWIEIFHIPKLIAPVLSSAINFPINFCLNKYWAFRRRNDS